MKNDGRGFKHLFVNRLSNHFLKIFSFISESQKVFDFRANLDLNLPKS